MRKAIGDVPGAKTYLSGFPAINHDTEPIYNDDLASGESIALPIALLVLAFMFGTLAGVAVPLAFALFTIPPRSGSSGSSPTSSTCRSTSRTWRR